MSERMVDLWKEARETRVKAEKWNDLPNGKKYTKSDFAISIAHCNKPMLNRMGQQYCGSQSYWETEAGFNSAILEYIVKNWESIFPEVHQILKDKESNTLKDCQSYVDEMQKLIDESGK